jgi:hypothetical protein
LLQLLSLQEKHLPKRTLWSDHMTSLTYKPEETGLLIVDPYNDFMSQGGKLFSVIETIASEVGLIANLRTLMVTLRDAGAKIFFVPHHRWEPGDYIHWKFANNTLSIAIVNFSGAGKTDGHCGQCR